MRNIKIALCALVLVLVCDCMGQVQKGSQAAIMEDIECARVYGCEVWYYPNGKISLVRWVCPGFYDPVELTGTILDDDN